MSLSRRYDGFVNRRLALPAIYAEFFGFRNRAYEYILRCITTETLLDTSMVKGYCAFTHFFYLPVRLSNGCYLVLPCDLVIA